MNKSASLQKRSKPARQRAGGIVGFGIITQLEAAGFEIVDRDEIERLRRIDANREARRDAQPSGD